MTSAGKAGQDGAGRERADGGGTDRNGKAAAVSAWLWLAIAIAAEVVATTALKASDGFTRLWPSVVVVAGYAVAFGCLAVAIRTVPVGIAYAIWSGVGIVLISLVAFWRFGQRLDGAALAGMGLIVAGVLVINLFSRSGTSH